MNASGLKLHDNSLSEMDLVAVNDRATMFSIGLWFVLIVRNLFNLTPLFGTLRRSVERSNPSGQPILFSAVPDRIKRHQCTKGSVEWPHL